MILIDFSAVCIVAITGSMNAKQNPYSTPEQLSKHLIYNKLRYINSKFKHKYGKMVICLDGSSYNWRYKSFPLYKCKRKKEKSDSYIDWKHLYEVMDEVISELREFFPYIVLGLDTCEADDIIGTLAKYIKERNIIISGDKDFMQLLGIDYIEQFAPKKDAFLKLEVSPTQYLLEHILQGDSADSIPNILSEDDIFTKPGVRQKQITKKYKENFTARLRNNELTEIEVKNFERNDKLINLNSIPKEIKLSILNAYQKLEIIGNKTTLLNFFIKESYNNFIHCIDEF
ncbi:MAG: hypothetical protein PHG08_00835 [Bacilli bacterium]|nr:hypothetical protein [Bacilli bacterium]